MIIESLRKIHKKHRLAKADVSVHTKSAQKITNDWQEAVCGAAIQSEVSVSPENNERIDIIDHSTNTAYELKVSGKNTHHEFYKDLVKVLTYNEYQAVKSRVCKLVFISELAGIKSLTGRLDSKFMTMLGNNHGLSIELVEI